MMIKKIFIIHSALLINFLTFSQIILVSPNDTSSISPKHTLTFSGYMEVYYNYSFNKPADGLISGRAFDIRHNQFTLSVLQTKLTYEKPKSKLVIDLIFGSNVELIRFGNPGITAIIKQAYFSYQFSKAIQLTVGQYATHVGYEAIESTINFNYSVSYLFTNGPFYHTGLKLDIALSKQIGLMVGIVNGWDQLMDYNNKKSFTAQLSFHLNKNWDLYLNWIGGDEYNGPSAFGIIGGSFTNLFDITSRYQINDKINVGLNSTFGFFKTGSEMFISSDPYSRDNTWNGIALYFNYIFSDYVALALRAERFEDIGNIRYFKNLGLASALTLTGNFHLGNNFHIYPECRWDNSSNLFYTQKNNLSKSQLTFETALIYSF